MARSLLVTCAGLMFASSVFAQDAATKPIKIALIGDSTVSTYAKPPADRPDLTGWGQVFGEFFTDRVTVLNHAASGRSSKSFRRENRWQPVLDAKPDYIFIQFGHNDQKEGDRYADPETDFREQMKQYITEARAAGATPVLVTPVARRTFAEGNATTTLTPYAEAMHLVGKDTKTPVLDLHKVSVAHYQKLGDEASADLTFGKRRPHPLHPQRRDDNGPIRCDRRPRTDSRVTTVSETTVGFAEPARRTISTIE